MTIMSYNGCYWHTADITLVYIQHTTQRRCSVKHCETKLSPLSERGQYVWIPYSLYCKIKLNIALLAVKDEGMLFMTDEIGEGTN